jgi:hypothetical protein
MEQMAAAVLADLGSIRVVSNLKEATAAQDMHGSSISTRH